MPFEPGAHAKLTAQEIGWAMSGDPRYRSGCSTLCSCTTSAEAEAEGSRRRLRGFNGDCVQEHQRGLRCLFRSATGILRLMPWLPNVRKLRRGFPGCCPGYMNWIRSPSNWSERQWQPPFQQPGKRPGYPVFNNICCRNSPYINCLSAAPMQPS